MYIKNKLIVNICLTITILYSIMSCKVEEKSVITDLEVTLNNKNSSNMKSYIFVTKWGSKGNKKGQFENPISMALDSKGNIYVTDCGNHPVQKFDPNGNYINFWEDQNSIDEPGEVSVDLMDNIYIINHNYGYSIKKFTSDGKLSEIFTPSSSNGNTVIPLDMAIDCNNIYVSSHKSVYKFDSSGNFITNWAATNFSLQKEIPESITGIAISRSGYIYVINSLAVPIEPYGIQSGKVFYLATIWVYNRNGMLLSKWNNKDRKNGRFDNFSSITIDSKDNIFISDRTNNCIWKFNSKGKVIAKFGTEGSSNGQFKCPENIVVDSYDNVYVLDCGNHRIQKFRPNHELK